ncbi:AraC family transcriptional regulator [Vibrio sp. B183]|uniref:AraC family transcriptional regulator n=1 Tax=Vibrio sp. B183 TaxID=1526762 RepID=UPI0005000E3F|nr:AraC family transcriptional regulator [Vibrio sp. B183]KFI10329.1 AraC family transcriptional regulator [Vibrio sp. B183]
MTSAKLRREQQIRTVCKYIDTHLDHELSLDQLSQIAVCSKYHFQRVFSAFMGISATQYVLFARLKRASFRLAFEKNITVTDIAFEAQFESSEAFSRAFSRTFGQTPSQFRSQPEWQQWHSKYEFNPPTSGEYVVDVNIVDFSEQPIAFIEHRGNPQRVFETAAKFIEWRKSTGLSPIKTSKTFGIPYGDPNQTPEEEFRFDICGSHSGEVPENPFSVKAGVIPAGRCAMALHKGSHDTIGDTIYQLYQQWLTTSGEELREFPVFFCYLNFVHEVDECDLLTEVYLPIK